ncbi:hypothetical protein EA472_17590 [Natrarchaeobius oligotrophus]|uniref:Uncharacterized protein n=1 Tax=Natrarchaeobius chitinivorans TaxID=1679083 RepID=A0A3N6NH87_NATCH|nr:hypothetical protein EA472_17590 [Natrarchaeobius chitinivorans]
MESDSGIARTRSGRFNYFELRSNGLGTLSSPNRPSVAIVFDVVTDALRPARAIATRVLECRLRFR